MDLFGWVCEEIEREREREEEEGGRERKKRIRPAKITTYLT